MKTPLTAPDTWGVYSAFVLALTGGHGTIRDGLPITNLQSDVLWSSGPAAV